MEDKKPIKIGIVGDIHSKEMEALMKLVAQEKRIEVTTIDTSGAIGPLGGMSPDDISLLKTRAMEEDMVIVVDSLGGMMPVEGNALIWEEKLIEEQREKLMRDLKDIDLRMPQYQEIDLKQPPSFECNGGKKQNIRRRKRGVNRRK